MLMFRANKTLIQDKTDTKDVSKYLFCNHRKVNLQAAASGERSYLRLNWFVIEL